MPPTNWRSMVETSTWQYDELSGEYYFHLYMAEQPDLNWDNPEVRQEICDTMEWWVQRGCDRFKVCSYSYQAY